MILGDGEFNVSMKVLAKGCAMEFLVVSGLFFPAIFLWTLTPPEVDRTLNSPRP